MAEAQEIAKLVVDLVLNDKGFSAKLKGAQASTKKFDAQLGKAANKIGGVLTKAFAAGTAAVGGFMAATAVVGTGFEKQITRVAAISMDGWENFDALEKKARELGSQTEFSAKQSAEAMLEFARAGMTTNEILNASRPALLLAGAAGADMALATQTMAATLRQFNLTSAESGRVSDVFSTALRSSLFDLQGLNDAMKYAGTTGAAFGMTLEETTAAVAQFRNLGLEASQAGTNFRMAMIQAAKATSEKEKVLNKLGLTMADINPEVKSFGEIMDVLGRASLSATDAITIFGARSGTNVKGIADRFGEAAHEIDKLDSELAAGNITQDQHNSLILEAQNNYEKLLGTLNESQGSTEALYEKMGDTVAYQATVAKSAFQELMLTVFDSYGGKLKELFKAITEVLTFTAQYFKSESADMKSSFDSSIGEMIDILRNNKEAIAIGFANLLNIMANLTKIFIKFIPYVETVVVLMAAAFVGAKVYAFAGIVVGVMIPAFTAATGAAASLAAAVNAATAGIPALIAGLTAAGLFVVGYALATDDASASVDHLRHKMMMINALIDMNKEKNEAAAKVALDAAKGAILAARERAAATGGIARVLDREYEAIMSLDAAQAEQMRTEGKLVESGGALWTIRGLLLGQGMTKGTEILNASLATQGTRVEATRSTLLELGAVYRALRDEHVHLAAAEQDSYVAQTTMFSSVEDLVAGIEGLNTILEQETEAQKQLEMQIRDTTTALKAEQAAKEIAANKKTEEKKNNAAAASYKKLKAERLSSAEQILALELRLQRDLRVAQGDTLSVFRLDLMKKEQEIKEAFDRERKAWKGNKAKLRAIDIQESLAMKDMRLQTEETVLAAVRKAATESSEAREQEGDNTMQALGRLQDIEMRDLQRHLAEVQHLYRDDADERIRAMTELTAEMAALEKEHSDARGNQRMKTNKEVDDAINAMRTEQARSTMSTVENIELDHMLFLVGQERTTQAQRDQIDEHFQDRIKDRREDIQKGIVKLKQGELTRVEKLEQDHADWLLENADATEEQKQEVSDHYSKEIRKARIKDAQDTAIKIAKTIVAIGQAFVGVIQGIQSVGAKVGAFFTGLADTLNGMLSTILGVEVSISGMMSDLGSGAVSAAEEGDAFDPVAFAQEMIDELVNNATVFVSALTEGLPTLLSGLAAALPDLLKMLAENLPIIIDAFVEALPTLLAAVADNIGPVLEALMEGFHDVVTVLIDALPDIIDAIVTYFPQMVSALLEEIPRIVEALMAALPDLITMILNMVAQIIDSLPDIIAKIIEAIPALITAILLGVDEIIMAVFNAIPLIINSIIMELPNILLALIEGLLQIIITLAGEVPKLITAIVQQIPILIFKLIESISEIIAAVIAAIPDIIIALVEAIPELVLAIVLMIPEILVALIAGLVGMIPQLVTALVFELIARIPEIVIALVVGLVQGIINAVKDFVQIVGDIFREALGWLADLFGKDENGDGFFKRTANSISDGLSKGWDKVSGWFSYSGIDYVPATMRVTVHKGEAVVPASRNPSNPGTGMDPALAGATGGGGGGGGGGTMDIAIMAEGRLLDAIQVTAMGRGHAPKMTRQLKRQSGVTAGFQRGRFRAWSK